MKHDLGTAYAKYETVSNCQPARIVRDCLLCIIFYLSRDKEKRGFFAKHYVGK